VADLMQQLLESVTSPFTSLFASVTSLVFTIIGAIGIFGVLQNTMDTIWGVNQYKSGFLQRIKRKIVPFLLISVLGFAIMVWTGITAVLLRILTYALNPLSSTTVTVTLRITQFGLSFVLATLLFAVIYKEIPDLAIQWRDVSLAAIITSLLFTMTNSLIGIIIEFFTITSVTGAAGSLMILLPWIFLINQFTLYGAAFSKVYTETVGSYSQKGTET
jgi:membrane protein